MPSSTPTACSSTNPCSELSSASASNACQNFYSNELATGTNCPVFSHAFSVSTQQELKSALDRSTTEGGGSITSRIIVLNPGDYEITHQLRVSHKVALVGVESNSAFPRIKAALSYSVGSFVTDSLVYIEGGINLPSDLGFYSYHIHWDTTPPTVDDDSYFHEDAITNAAFPGELRIVESQFSQTSMTNPSSDYISLEDATGHVYIGYNHFDTTHLATHAVFADCGGGCPASSAGIIIESNDFSYTGNSSRKKRQADYSKSSEPAMEKVNLQFVDDQDPEGYMKHYREIQRQRRQANTPEAIDIRHYTNFTIRNNRQLHTDALGRVRVSLDTGTSGISGVISNNMMLPGASGEQKVIEFDLLLRGGDFSALSGSITVANNNCYSRDQNPWFDTVVTYTEGGCVSYIPMPSSTAVIQPASTSSQRARYYIRK